MTIEDALKLFLVNDSDLFDFENSHELYKGTEENDIGQYMISSFHTDNLMYNIGYGLSQILNDSIEKIERMNKNYTHTIFEVENNQLNKVSEFDKTSKEVNSDYEKLWSEKISLFYKENEVEKDRYLVSNDILDEKKMFYQNNYSHTLERNNVREGLDRIQKYDKQKERYESDSKIWDTVYRQNNDTNNALYDKSDIFKSREEEVTKNYNSSRYENNDENYEFEHKLENIWSKESEIAGRDFEERNFLEDKVSKGEEITDSGNKTYQIQIFNQFGDINNTGDMNEMISYLENKLYEAAASAAEGVHS